MDKFHLAARSGATEKAIIFIPPALNLSTEKPRRTGFQSLPAELILMIFQCVSTFKSTGVNWLPSTFKSSSRLATNVLWNLVRLALTCKIALSAATWFLVSEPDVLESGAWIVGVDLEDLVPTDIGLPKLYRKCRFCGLTWLKGGLHSDPGKWLAVKRKAKDPGEERVPGWDYICLPAGKIFPPLPYEPVTDLEALKASQAARIFFD